MARRKNTKRIDPRYFLNETTYRDLNEQEAMVLDLSDPRKFRSVYSGLLQKLGKHPILKIPGKEEYYQMRDTRKTTQTSTGDYDNKFGAALDYASTPDMKGTGLAAQIEPGDEAATNTAVWLAQILSKKTDKVEVVG